MFVFVAINRSLLNISAYKVHIMSHVTVYLAYY